MPKYIVQQNFVGNDLHEKDPNAKSDKLVPRTWEKGEEYDGSDDTERLLAEGLIAEEKAEKSSKGKKAKKMADELEEGEAINTEGEEVDETVPANGEEADGEEEAEEEEKPAPKKKAPAKKKPAKKG